MSGNTRRFCPHCEETLASRTFREHLRLYYDADSHTWTKRRRVDLSNDADQQQLQEPDQPMDHSSNDPPKASSICICGHKVVLVNLFWVRFQTQMR